jgi:hypothetical protein
MLCPKCKHEFGATEEPCNKCRGEKLTLNKKQKTAPCNRCNASGLEISAKNRNNRSRGANNEYKVRDLFAAWWLKPDGTQYEWARTPQSGGNATLAAGFNMAGDITTTAPDWPWHVEAKRTKGWSFDQLLTKAPEIVGELGQHMAQAVDEAPTGKIPLLFLQNPGPSQPAYVMVIGQVGCDDLCSAIMSHFPGSINGMCVVNDVAYRYYILSAKKFVEIPAKLWRLTYD